MTVEGAVTIDQSNNLAGLERQLAALADTTAPDEPAQAKQPSTSPSHPSPVRTEPADHDLSVAPARPR
ncbi:hypothetical protein [Streptomyces sp. NPDC056632]|uniref:hypothetical protein n=1 Tax=Streptomyces sp. NPDC056632 TaxID=3345884 RepID=UPI0036936CCD